MKSRVLFASAALCLFALICFAADSFTGTWKLNEAKSKFPPGAPKNNTVVYQAAGDSTKVIIDGVDGDGKPTHVEWTGKMDGKDYPSSGSTLDDARSYTKIDDHTLHIVIKKGGKEVGTAHVVTSADGKTRTVTVTVVGADGKKSSSTAVYDKQ
jgi:VCBS repeat-containing protein